MESERELVAPAVEEEEAVEIVGGGLEVRRRRSSWRVGVGIEGDGAPPVPVEETDGDRRSVYFDEQQGVWKCHHCIWTYQLSVPSIYHAQKHEDYCQVAMNVESLIQPRMCFDSPIKDTEISNGTSGMEIREEDHFINEKNQSVFNGKAENLLIHDMIQSKEKASMENGSNLQLSLDKYNGNGITIREHEVEEDLHVQLVKDHKLEVADIDLKKVLDEQDTHDLYCPNCNSCITKRVILRKRKRTAPQIQPDSPPAKIQQVQQDPDASRPFTVSSEVSEVDHNREPDVFRCLSCFSFFIPTEGGFNIFRIFRKSSERDSLTTPQELPVENDNWISSIFKLTNRKIGTETVSGLPLPNESLSTSKQQLGESSVDIKISQATTSFETVKRRDTTTENDADGIYLEKRKSSAITVTGTTKHQEARPQTTFERNDTGIHGSMLEEIDANNVKPMGGPPQVDKHKSSGLPQSILGNMIPGHLAVDIGENLDNATLHNDAGNSPVSENTPKFGEQMEDSAHIYNFSTTTTSISGIIVHEGQTGINQKLHDLFEKTDEGDNIIQTASTVKPAIYKGILPTTQNIIDSALQAVDLPHGEIQIHVGEQTGENRNWDVLKSIVYGGLVESVTGLGVISSAAGTDATTLNIVALGLANLIGGLFVITHDLSELKSTRDQPTDRTDERAGRYWELLGRRENFRKHAIIAVFTYIISGLLPPLIYGFSFRKSDNKEHKLIALAAASLACIALLAIGKAHVNPRKNYIKTLLYYLGLGVSVSGLSYVSGVMISRLLVQLGVFDGSAGPSPPIIYGDLSSVQGGWSSW